jgi:hypothetical protein
MQATSAAIPQGPTAPTTPSLGPYTMTIVTGAEAGPMGMTVAADMIRGDTRRTVTQEQEELEMCANR